MNSRSDNPNNKISSESPKSSSADLEVLEGKKVLIIDDDHLVLKATERRLMSFSKNCEVVCSSSGNDAIQKIESGFKPDLVLSDIMMQNGTGMDFYNRLNETGMHDLANRTIFISGGVPDQMKDFHQHIVDKGCFIEKPYSPDELRERITEVLRNINCKFEDVSEKPANADSNDHEEKILAAEKIVHEFNNPLAIIMSNAYLLKESLEKRQDLTEDEREMIEDIIEGGDRLRKLVKQLQLDIKEGKMPFETKG